MNTLPGCGEGNFIDSFNRIPRIIQLTTFRAILNRDGPGPIGQLIRTAGEDERTRIIWTR